ncbi:molybdopterin-synthase adenylyltransferase MoeB [Halioxenophilus sp. WMMB6]|uniref:HesA/MoeB/ThiF family protein n=1 Tax=Halioxenophilus sp. WMMB6 TaxID=3073815 RepID=UPI00295E3E1E|nr:molybdopterin-synthase adenylyltransferase MoeB [Halioxenophilus sp. WMMB6]
MRDDQLLRYSRHILLPQLDVEGQERLLAAKVLVVGAGGLGSPVILYLAASGVGELIVVDDDAVELSNLQRQIAHQSGRIGVNKALSAGESARALNPDVVCHAIEARLSDAQAAQWIAKVDVVVDCTDNLASRLQINRLCYQLAVPLVSAAAIGTEGQLLVVDSRAGSPCYQCLYDENTELQLNCAESGVLAPVVGVLGALQALETIKVLSHAHETGVLHLWDAWAGQWQRLSFAQRPDCPVCG